jgi:hypothetical protein
MYICSHYQRISTSYIFADCSLDADILSSAEPGPFHLQKPNPAPHYHRNEFLCHSSAQRRAQLSLDAFHTRAGLCFDPPSTRMLCVCVFLQ